MLLLHYFMMYRNFVIVSGKFADARCFSNNCSCIELGILLVLTIFVTENTRKYKKKLPFSVNFNYFVVLYSFPIHLLKNLQAPALQLTYSGAVSVFTEPTEQNQVKESPATLELLLPTTEDRGAISSSSCFCV